MIIYQSKKGRKLLMAILGQTSGGKTTGSAASGLDVLNKNKNTSTGSGTGKVTGGVTGGISNVVNGNYQSSNSGSTSSGSSGGYYGGSSSGGNGNDLLEYFKQQNAAARDAALNALQKRLDTNLALYQSQYDQLGDDYQSLRNQSEIEKYKARSSMREALANRGQLDSGYGRQETLNLNTKFGNAINNINLQERAAKNDILNIMNQLRAEKDAEEAQIRNQYNAAIAQYMA